MTSAFRNFARKAQLIGIISSLSLSISLASVASSRAQEITLRVDAAASIYAPMFNELAQTFEAQNPNIRISMDTSSRSQVDEFQKTLRLALVDDLPDVSFQGPNYLAALAQDGHIIPLDKWINADPEWTEDRFSPSVVRSTQISGQTMGLGVGFSFPIIYYNVDLVKESQSGDVTLPKDWDSILVLAQKIQTLHPGQLGIYSRFEALYSQGVIRSLGGRIGDSDGKHPTLSDPNTMKGIELFQRIGALGQGANGMTGDQARQAFSAGQIAIHLDSSSSLGRFLEDSNGHFSLGTAPLPLADLGELPTSGFAVVMHVEDPTRQEAAWRFMKFVASSEGQTILGKNTGFVPANEVALTASSDLAEYYSSIPQVQAVTDSIRRVAPWYLFDTNNNERIDALFADYMEKVVAQKTTPEVAEKELTSQIDELIN